MLTTVNLLLSYTRGIKLIFTGDHISIEVAFKEPNVTLGLRKCNYSLTRGEELYIWPLKETMRLMRPPVKMSLVPVS